MFTSRVKHSLFFTLVLFPAVLSAQKSVVSDVAVLNNGQKRYVITAQKQEQIVELRQLQAGETYVLIVPPDYELGTCLPDMSVVEPTATQISYSPAQHALRLTAASNTARIRLSYPCNWPDSNPPRHYISLSCLECPRKEGVSALAEMAVLEVENAGLEELVKDIFIGGDCFDVTGISMTGGSNQIGKFFNGATSIGFNGGIMLATGDISVAPGPNDQDGAGGGGTGGADNDLNTIATGPMFDVCTIEFDFTPTQSMLSFEYVFASEEYCEYVNTQFNDVFGFFISGPGINGTKNLATISTPTSAVPITINTINHITNSALYVHNTPPGEDRDNCQDGGISGGLLPATPSLSQATQECEFDGFTRRMTASVQVVPCSTYHIKLAIADVGDGLFDSAVFLRAGSFAGGGNASIKWVVNDDPTLSEVTEGCGDVKILVDRLGSNFANSLSVPYTITGTAASGADFTPIPGSITIPAGQEQVLFPVNILTDALDESAETIILTLNNACSCLHPQEILTIHDYKTMKLTPDTVSVCGPSALGTVGVDVDGGHAPYTYKWSSGGTEPTMTATVSASTTYTVTVTDACGKSLVANARIIVTSAPTAKFLPSVPQLCPGQSAVLQVDFSGNGPFELRYTLNDDHQTPIAGASGSPYLFQVTQPGVYTLTGVVDSLGCVGTASGSANVIPSDLTMSAASTNPTCPLSTDGTISVMVSGGTVPYKFNWTGNTPIGNMSNPVNLLPGQYSVTVTDFWGCTQTKSLALVAPNAITPSAVIQGVTCSAPLAGSIDVSVTGGVPGFAYNWSNGSTAQDINNLSAGSYMVTISDNGGCSTIYTAVVPSNTTPPVANAVAEGTLTCSVNAISLNAGSSSAGPEFTYKWTASPGSIISGGNTLAPVIGGGGNYTLLVTNTINGCTAEVTVPVIPDVTPPVVSAGTDAAITCLADTVTLNGSSLSQGSGLIYRWTASSGGAVIGSDSTLQINTTMAGIYTLTATNTSNGCTATDNVTVALNNNPPNPATRGGLITCVMSNVMIFGDTVATSYSYSWSGCPQCNILLGKNTRTPVVNAPGIYTVTVTDNSNGCTNTAVAIVGTDVVPPTAEAVVQDTITCSTKSVTVNVSGLTAGPGYMYQWQTPVGQMATGSSIQANVPGTYKLTVTNLINSCTATTTALVLADLATPVADAGIQDTLTCTQQSLELHGTGYGASQLTYEWSTADGSIVSPVNVPNPTIGAPGTYRLVVTNPSNGCSATDLVTVYPDTERPEVKISTPGVLNCVTPQTVLSSAGSSTGAAFSYRWSGPGLVTSPGMPDATVNQPGTYSLVVTNGNNGCTVEMSVSVIQNVTAPAADAGPDRTLTCQTPEVPIGGSGNPSGQGYSIKWDGQVFDLGGTIWTNQPGNYTITVTNNQNGCTSTDVVTVDQDVTSPQADAGQDAVLTCLAPEYILQGSGSTGARYVYRWFASSGNIPEPPGALTPRVNAPGVYTLMVTDTVNGCVSTSSVTITQSISHPVAAIESVKPLTCDTITRNLNAIGSSTGTNFTYQWSSSDGGHILSGANTLEPLVDEPGTYSLVVTNQTNGCTETASVMLTENVVLPVADAGPDRMLTCQTPEVPIGGPGNSSGQGYTIKWNGQVFDLGGTTWTNQPGNYTITVTDTQNGCTSTDVVTVTQDVTLPQANAGQGTMLNCQMPVYTLQGSASTGSRYVYRWFTSTGNIPELPGVLNPEVSMPGVYTLMVTDTVNGCVATSSVTITQSPNIPVAAIGAVQPFTCDRTTQTLDGTASSSGSGYVYQWTPTDGGHIVSGANTLTPLIDEPGTYSLLVADQSNGCTETASVVVAEDVTPPPADAGVGTALTCALPQVTLSGSVQLSHSNWMVYWEASSGGNIVGNQHTLTPTVDAGGVYKMTVKNLENGCTSSDVVTVPADQVHPDARIDIPAALTCANQSTSLNPVGSSTGNVNYLWTTNAGHFIQPINPAMPQVDQPGVYTLLVTYLSNGCTASATVTVPQDIERPVANAGADGILTCAVTTLKLNETTAGQQVGYQYLWTASGGGQILSGSNTLTPTIGSGGTYTLVVTDLSNGCSDSDAVTVALNTQAPVAMIATPGEITCREPMVLLSGSGSQSGSSIEYDWTTTNGRIENVSGSNCTVSKQGVYTLKVSNTANGCAAQRSVTVNENLQLPVADAGPSLVLDCFEETVILDGTESSGHNYTYQWTTQAGNLVSGDTTLTPKVDEPGVYMLQVTNRLTGCKSTDTVHVTINVPTDIVLDMKRPGCKGNDGVIRFLEVKGGTGPYLYSIDGGETFVQEVNFENITSGTYSLFIQDVKGCEFQENIVVPDAPQPSVTLPSYFELELGDSLTLNAALPVGYPVSLIETVIWTPQEGLSFRSNSIQDMLRPTVKPFKSSEYTVSIVSKDGCEDRDSVLIRVDDEPRIYVPNAFSPLEQDGENDIFMIFADDKQILQVDQFQVYDRWGEVVFSAANFQPNDPSYGWDGFHGGKPMQPGVFVYYIEIKRIDGRKLLLKGDVTLVK